LARNHAAIAELFVIGSMNQQLSQSVKRIIDRSDGNIARRAYVRPERLIVGVVYQWLARAIGPRIEMSCSGNVEQ
jgi:hypothetical protein